MHAAGLAPPIELLQPGPNAQRQPDPLRAVRRARLSLAQGIEWAFNLKNAHPAVYSKAFASERYDSLGQVEDRSRKLSDQLIAQDAMIGGQLFRHLPPDEGPTLAQIVRDLKRLEAAAASARTRLKDADLHDQPLFPDDDASATTDFIAELARVFEKAYGTPPRTGPRDSPSGPFVAFVTSITSEALRKRRYDELLSGVHGPFQEDRYPADVAEKQCEAEVFEGMSAVAIAKALSRAGQK